MEVKPIDTLLKSHFYKIFETANDKAIKDFNENIIKITSTLNNYETYVILDREEERIEKIIEDHQSPFYIDNYSSDDWLLSLFANRTFLLNKDESVDLMDSVYIGKYRSLLYELKSKIGETIPIFTYTQFIEGEKIDFLSLIYTLKNVSEVDFYKIKNWQAESLFKIVNHDTKIIIKKVQEYCKSIDNPLKFINRENEILELLFKRSDHSNIKDIISLLFISNFLDIELLDDSILNLNFDPFTNEKLSWNLITPNTVGKQLINVENSFGKIVSNEYTIFYTINKLKEWYEEVLSGKSIFAETKDINWEITIKEALDKGQKKAYSITKKINEFAYNNTKTKKEIGEYLLSLMDEYRRKFNNIDFKYYFHFLQDEKLHLLNNFFIVNSYFGNDLQKQTAILIESKFIYEVSWELTKIYYEIFDGDKITSLKKYGSAAEIYFIIQKMILDKELYVEFSKIKDDFLSFESYFMPMDFFFMNHNENMSSLFSKLIDKLQETLNESETTNKIIYIQSRIKELKQRELKLNQYKKRDGFSKRDLKFSSLLKDFLKIESEFINETKLVTDLKFLKLPEKKILPSSPTIANDVIPEERMNLVLKLLEDLAVTTNGKSNLSERKKGALRGIVLALREENIIPYHSLEILTNHIASRIGLEIKSKLDSSTISDDYEKKTRSYLKNNQFK